MTRGSCQVFGILRAKSDNGYTSNEEMQYHKSVQRFTGATPRWTSFLLVSNQMEGQILCSFQVSL
jgi:hypothetical protein